MMFRLLGFNVHVQSGFLIFMVLIVSINPGEFGFWLAGSLFVLTLVHELGHAMAARRTGAEAEISLGFLAGYASYRPSRALSRLEQAWISFAGPFLHIGVSVAILLAMGINPVDRDSFTETAAAQAIWWAGPVIGMLNLIPVLPLDGGTIVAVGLDRLLPGRSRRIMLYFSIAVTLSAVVYMFVTGQRGFVFFIGFLLITQFQMLTATKKRADAPSPWQAASAALDAGKTSKARRALLAALSHPQPPSRTATADLSMSPAKANALIAVLPTPFPHGDPLNEYILGNLLLSTARYDEAAHYAAGSYERLPNALSASIVARAAAALGDQATAIGWLRSAAASDANGSTASQGLVTVIDQSPELVELRNHPDVVAIRRNLAPSA
jgi:Zn-dependent protease